ncbi:LPS export ABC transporter periplasmic protein LptC [bacterium]|nr:LPS export ABC transporter periplasmic protein LptC [bacterium]
MVKFIKRILSIKWAIPGLLIVVIVYLIFNPAAEKSDKKPADKEKERPMIIMNPILKDYKNEELSLKLIADKAEIYEKTQSTILTSPIASLFDEADASKVTIIRAKTGELENKKDLIHLWGDVRIEFFDGQRLFTEDLFVNNKQRVIYNSVKVKVESKDEVINAASMRYTMDNEVLLLKKPNALLSL